MTKLHMSLYVTDVSELAGYINGVMERADHHAVNGKEGHLEYAYQKLRFLSCI
jgi:hypothetical protein